MGKSHHRKGYRDKNGVWHRPTRVRGSNPAQGCSFLLLGTIGLAAVVGRRVGRR